jgi:hypothetical protein
LILDLPQRGRGRCFLVPHPARRIEEEIARIDKRCHPVKPTAEPGRTRSALLAGSGSGTIAQH